MSLLQTKLFRQLPFYPTAISRRFLPDKAIDLIDEAGARMRVATMNQPSDIAKLESQIEETRRAKEKAISTQEYEKAARLAMTRKNNEKSCSIRTEWETNKEEHQVPVDEDAVAQVVARANRDSGHAAHRRGNTKTFENGRDIALPIIGQDEAVDVVCRAIRRGRTGIKDPNRPTGSFLFLGPTGVGKTHLARLLATHMYGGEDALIQVDMSEYMEKFAVSRMTGSPPGYVGHEEGGAIDRTRRQRPYCVVLFDEIEKAHPDVMDLLLQILEEGRLTDAFGRKVDFRHAIVIMTSNLGADLIRKIYQEIGFGAQQYA